jgi:hypothetical protein
MNPDRDMANSIPDPYFAIKREKEGETRIDSKRESCDIICLSLSIVQPCFAISTQLKVSYDVLMSNVPKEKSLENLKLITWINDLLKAL